MSSVVKTVNTRVRLPAELHRQLRHAAVDRGVTVNELLVQGARLVVVEREDRPREARPGER
jgi:predicted HicB family RNase H-like nuclease